MGVIQRQGFKSSVIGFIGVAIGALSTLYVYPKSLEVLGLFRSLFDASVLIGIVALMGSSVSAVRFFPKYKDSDSGHNGLLTWLLLVSASGFLFFLLLYPLVKPWLLDFIFDDRNKVYEDVLWYIIPLTFLVAMINLLSRYISNFRRIAIPTIFEQLTIKITLPVVILLYVQGWIQVTGIWVGIILSYVLANLGLVFYLVYLGEWKLTKPVIWTDKPALKEYSRYSWYGLLSGIGSQIAFRLDSFLVAGLIQFQAAGIYAISMALSEIIVKPSRTLNTIAGPMIAHYIEEGNMNEVQILYRKSALNMTIIGAGLFLLIWTILPHIFEVMPNSDVMQQGAYVVFFLGLAQVWDMMTGVNSEIITYSRYYRTNLYLTLFLAGLNVLTNLWLIPLYGLTGAALATCISMFLFNVVKLLFIRWKFGLQPFSTRLIPAIGFAIAAWLMAAWLPVTGQPYADMVIKGGAFSLIYGIAVWRLAISPDINQWLTLAVGQVRNLSLFRSKS